MSCEGASRLVALSLAGPAGLIEALLQRCTQRPADQFATLRGVGEKLWVLNRPEELKLIQNALAKRDIFIADGHHRYTTALNYRATLGDVPAEHPANFVMFVLASMSDPGLIILPTHRLISGLSVWNFERFVDSLRADMDVTPLEVSAGSAADADALLEPDGPHSMAFLSGEQAVVARLKTLSAMDVLAAKAQYAYQNDMTCPEVSERGALVYDDARHPMLLDRLRRQEKGRCPPEKRTEVLAVVHTFKGQVVDLAERALTVQVTGNSEKVDALHRMLDRYGVIEMVRTGKVIVARGQEVT